MKTHEQLRQEFLFKIKDSLNAVEHSSRKNNFKLDTFLIQMINSCTDKNDLKNLCFFCDNFTVDVSHHDETISNYIKENRNYNYGKIF